MIPWRIRFWGIMFALIVIGTVLIRMAGMYESRVDGRAAHTVMNALASAKPNMTVREADSTSQVVASWRELREREPVKVLLARDVGLAFIVAVILTVTIEWHTRNRLFEEVTRNVLEATYRRLLPEGFFEVVRNSVLQSNVMKDDWRIGMSLVNRPELVLPEGVFLAHTEVSFTLRNRTPGVVTERITWELDDDVQMDDAAGRLPRFLEIAIGDRILTPAEVAKGVVAEGRSFSTTLELRQSPTRVRIKVEELIRVPDTFCWHTRHCTSIARVSINTDAIENTGVTFDVRARHPFPDLLNTLTPGHEWEFVGAMLPWHSLEFCSTVAGKPRATIANQRPTPVSGLPCVADSGVQAPSPATTTGVRTDT